VTPGGNGHHPLDRDDYDDELEPQEAAASGNGYDPTGGAAGASRVRVGRQAQLHGVVVPLRVPLGTRLKAGIGLCALVVVLGTATALIVVGVALAGAQALSGL
jgi:hypothetical protein